MVLGVFGCRPPRPRDLRRGGDSQVQSTYLRTVIGGWWMREVPAAPTSTWRDEAVNPGISGAELEQNSAQPNSAVHLVSWFRASLRARDSRGVLPVGKYPMAVRGCALTHMAAGIRSNGFLAGLLGLHGAAIHPISGRFGQFCGIVIPFLTLCGVGFIQQGP